MTSLSPCLFDLHFLMEGAEVGDCTEIPDRSSVYAGMLAVDVPAAVQITAMAGDRRLLIACERMTSAKSRCCEAAEPFLFDFRCSSTSRWMSTISCSSCSFSVYCSSVPDVKVKEYFENVHNMGRGCSWKTGRLLSPLDVNKSRYSSYPTGSSFCMGLNN